MNKLLRLFGRGHEPDVGTLSARLDGRLDVNTSAAVDAHLATCDACRTRMAALRSVSASLRAIPQIDAPRSFRLRVADVERAPAQRSFAVPAMRFAPALAAIAALVFLIAGAVDLAGSADIGRGGSASKRSAHAPAAASNRAAESAPQKSMASADTSSVGAAGSAASAQAGVLPPEPAAPQTASAGQPQDNLTGTETALRSAPGTPFDATAIAQYAPAPSGTPIADTGSNADGAPAPQSAQPTVQPTNAPDAAPASTTLPSGAIASGDSTPASNHDGDLVTDNAVATVASRIFAASTRQQSTASGNNGGGSGVIRTIEVVAGALAIAAGAIALYSRMRTKEELR